MLMPKKVKYRKQQRGRMTGKAWRGSTLAFGQFGLKVLEPGWITDRQGSKTVGWVLGWALLAWNGLVLLVYAADLRHLPPASHLSIERSFDGVLNQLQPSRVTLTITNTSAKALRCTVTDDVPQSLTQLPPELSIAVPGRS